jgi:hypothetical protein
MSPSLKIRQMSHRLLALAIASTLIVVAFALFVRPWYLNWGATVEERARVLPGDEIVADYATQQTRAITINAAARDVWPWIAQTGQDRGGFYSFDLLENLVGCEMPTSDVLRADKQVWQIGDKLWMYPSDKAGGAGFATLRVFEPGRALGFGTRTVGTTLDQSENGSWTFVLDPVDTRSARLLIRGRGEARPSLLGLTFDRAIFEPIHFAMERRMMMGLKQLAETGARNRFVNHVYIALWLTTAVLGLLAAIAVIRRHRWIRALAAFVMAAAVFQVLTLGQPPLIVAILLVAAALAMLRTSAPSQRTTIGAARPVQLHQVTQ